MQFFCNYSTLSLQCISNLWPKDCTCVPIKFYLWTLICEFHVVFCCCWVASVVSDSVRPQRWQPTRLPRPWDSPGKNTGVGCHLLLQCMNVKSESEVAQLCPTLSNPWTAAHQAPLSIGFSRQEYWSGVPLPSLSFLLIKHYFSLIFFNSLKMQKPFLA